MSGAADVSVVIGFRNWGVRRLELAVKSIQDSFQSLSGEVIVSDYGSTETDETRLRMEALGAKYVYTATSAPWSRSRALNAGFAHSTGRVLVSTDADMIFSPTSMETIASLIIDDESLCLLLQCRDLPKGWSDAEVQGQGFCWDTFDKIGRLRPRWGMGGMMAVPRQVFERIRGLDERMHTYGGEDIDFATRARRSGQRLLWVNDERVRMYHMWHPPTRQALSTSIASEEAIEYNKKIVYNDRTFVRNVSSWSYPLANSRPLVSVAISTQNRAPYLKDSINSVLMQTMQDFEIIVVDDGSTDDTKAVVEGFQDPRIRYCYQPSKGISAARNRAADLARGFYTAVHDDDDLMTPWRLEKHFDCIEPGVHGSFGSFVNFDDSTGEMVLYASKNLNAGTVIETGGAPGHGTWMVETRIIRRIRYEERISSGVDNNLALRMVRSGVNLRHSGEVLMLRRLHPDQITVTDDVAQKGAANQTRALFEYNVSKWGRDKLLAERGKSDFVPIRFANDLGALKPYLPDSLVERTVEILDSTQADASGLPGSVVRELAENGDLLRVHGRLYDVKLEDLVRLRSLGLRISVSAQLRDTTPVSPDPRLLAADFADDSIGRAITHSSSEYALSRLGDRSAVVVVSKLSETASPALSGRYAGEPTEHRTFESEKGSTDVVYATFQSFNEIAGDLDGSWTGVELFSRESFDELISQLADVKNGVLGR